MLNVQCAKILFVLKCSLVSSVVTALQTHPLLWKTVIPDTNNCIRCGSDLPNACGAVYHRSAVLSVFSTVSNCTTCKGMLSFIDLELVLALFGDCVDLFLIVVLLFTISTSDLYPNQLVIYKFANNAFFGRHQYFLCAYELKIAVDVVRMNLCKSSCMFYFFQITLSLIFCPLSYLCNDKK